MKCPYCKKETKIYRARYVFFEGSYTIGYYYLQEDAWVACIRAWKEDYNRFMTRIENIKKLKEFQIKEVDVI